MDKIDLILKESITKAQWEYKKKKAIGQLYALIMAEKWDIAIEIIHNLKYPKGEGEKGEGVK